MSAFLSFGVVKIFSRGSSCPLPVIATIRSISSKHNADVSRPPPFPYERRDYRFTWFDDTEDRFNQNSKIIVVDGPMASGKTEFCKKLADELDMLAIPPANMDALYKVGDFDWRSLDDEWSTESLKTFDEKKFSQNPNHVNAAMFQIRMLQIRYSQYFDAVAHMLSTGQGVVLQRSPYSDYIFAEAMDRCGYISKRAKDIYYEIFRSVEVPLYKPHLIIYLDVPVANVKENVKKRNYPWEQNSPILNDTYLARIEELYKNDFLKKMSTSSELLVYDWRDGGDVEVVVEDIEMIDFDNYDNFSEKLRQWRELTTREWNWLRREYADRKCLYMARFECVERFDAPELIHTPDEILEFDTKIAEIPEILYQPGFNPKKDNILTKFFIHPKDRNIYIY